MDDNLTIGVDGRPTAIRYRQMKPIPLIDTKRKKKEAEQRRMKDITIMFKVVNINKQTKD